MQFTDNQPPPLVPLHDLFFLHYIFLEHLSDYLLKAEVLDTK